MVHFAYRSCSHVVSSRMQNEVPFMKENRLLFTNALIVLPTETIKGSLAVEDGKITGIFESGTELPGFTEVDVHGKALMPGAIDTHVHMWDPSPLNYREDWACGSQCAASGGITTIIDMPLSVPPVVDKEGFQLKLDVAQKESCVDFAFWGGLTPNCVQNMSTLLIGGNGLIGTRLSAYLADHGEEVFSYSLHSPSQKHPGVHYIQGDVTDYGTLNMLLKQNHIDRIIHNAGVSHPKMFRDNPYKIYRTNVNGVLTSLEAARNYGVDRYVYISSGAVYGNVHYDVVDETIPLHAENPYGATKVACEELVRNYGLDSVSLRVGFVYGPGRVNECPVNMILSTLLKEGKVDWDHGSEQMLDFIYIEDCVEAIAKISLADHNPHAEYNIGGGEVIPYTRIIDKARKLFPTAPIHVGPGDLGYDNLGALSVQRAFEDFGWKPRFSIEQGMEQYMNWLKNF